MSRDPGQEPGSHPELDEVPLRPEPGGQDPIAARAAMTARQSDDDAPREPGQAGGARRWWVLGLVVVLLLISAAVAYILLRRGIQPGQILPTPPVAPPVAAAPPPESPPPAIDLPPLNDSDGTVRQALAGLSAHPGFAAWLGADELIRRFTATVDNVAEGVNPKTHLPFLRPRGEFQVVQRGPRTFIDPASYRRYNALGDVAAEVDPAEAARLFRAFEPLVDSAYRELGYPEGAFRDKLAAAISNLLAAPVLEEEVEVEPLVLTYGYKDPALEGLSPAQKQLLRTGPRNVRILKNTLRQLAKELELPLN